MDFDENLMQEEKLKHLRSILNDTFSLKARKAAPAPLCEADNASWRDLKFAFSGIEHALESYGAEEVILRDLYDHGSDGLKNMSALHSLSWLLEDRGRYPEAEAAARDVLPWIREHQVLGSPDSPQALGCMRILVKSIWKQGRHVEAEEWVEACETTIENLGKGKFAKYQQDEKGQFDAEMEALRRMSAATSAKTA